MIEIKIFFFFYLIYLGPNNCWHMHFTSSILSPWFFCLSVCESPCILNVTLTGLPKFDSLKLFRTRRNWDSKNSSLPMDYGFLPSVLWCSKFAWKLNRFMLISPNCVRVYCRFQFWTAFESFSLHYNYLFSECVKQIRRYYYFSRLQSLVFLYS